MIEDLLIDFDEMGFAPTPICGINPEEYARKWKSELVSEIDRLQEDYSKLQELFANYQLASDKEIRAQVRQAKIDVLNELKSKCHNYYPSIDHYCCSVKAVTLSDIDNIIKELIK